MYRIINKLNSTLLFFTICFIISCSSKKYKISNTLGDENVDVTTLITKKGFKPIYNGNEIQKLINPNPNKITGEDNKEIFKFICNYLSDINFTDIDKNTKYEYTYFITYKSVDVFSIEINSTTYQIKFEIRKEGNKLILPTNEGEWKVELTENHK